MNNTIWKNAMYCSLGILVLMASCKQEKTIKIDTPEVAFTKEGELQVLKAESDSLLVKLDIEIAESEYETQTGLMYREGMEDGQGMLFIFDSPAYHSFYMKNTKFPIDIIFIDANLMVASIQKNAQPLDETGLSSGVPVQYVLEVNAGLSDKWTLEIGDRITYSRSGPNAPQ